MNNIFGINEYCYLKINKIILLNDNKIVACADDGNVYIYTIANKDNEYYYYKFSCIKITDIGEVRDIIEMDDGNIIVCGEEGSINIIKISKSNAFYVDGVKPTDYSINQIIKLLDGNIIACSDDGHLYIFKYNSKEESLEMIRAVFLHYQILNICQCNNNELAASVFEKDEILWKRCSLRFYDNSYQLITSIKLKNMSLGQKLETINENKLFACDGANIIIINLKNHSIINKYKINKINIFFLFKDNILLGGDKIGNIYKWEIKNNNINLKNIINVHYNECVSGIIKFKGNKFITCGHDGNIVIWEDKE